MSKEDEAANAIVEKWAKSFKVEAGYPDMDHMIVYEVRKAIRGAVIEALELAAVGPRAAVNAGYGSHYGQGRFDVAQEAVRRIDALIEGAE